MKEAHGVCLRVSRVCVCVCDKTLHFMMMMLGQANKNMAQNWNVPNFSPPQHNHHHQTRAQTHSDGCARCSGGAKTRSITWSCSWCWCSSVDRAILRRLKWRLHECTKTPTCYCCCLRRAQWLNNRRAPFLHCSINGTSRVEHVAAAAAAANL